MIRRPSFAGVVVGLAFGCAAAGPSLLPRSAAVAGLLVGACAAAGYGMGAALGWLARRIRREPGWRVRRGPLVATAAGAAVVVGVAAVWGWRQQVTLAALVGVAPPPPLWPFLVFALGAVLAFLLVAVGRGLRRLTRSLAAVGARVVPPAAATVSAVCLVVVVGAAALLRLPLLVTTALDPVFRSMNAATSDGVVPPTDPLVSGAAGSAVTWQSLGHDGRDFIGGAPTRADISGFSGRPARWPVRVYVGLDSSSDPDERARLAVRDLDAFAAWDRQVLAIGTSTGTGTVDEGEVLPLEYLYDGDVATVSTQYSVLPSFLSFLVDGENAQRAARSLFTAVYERWREEPPDQRPRLVVFGESLGAFGGDAAFSDLPQLARRTSAALFVGPPNATALWRRLTDDREPGSPEWLPLYGRGRVVRWADRPEDLEAPPTVWGPSRPVYLQNATDPVVWWSADLLWARPDWLGEPRGPDVLPTLTWLPLFTFAGLTGDMIDSQGVPPANGHVYGTHPARSWALMIPPRGWTDRDTDRLVALLQP